MLHFGPGGSPPTHDLTPSRRLSYPGEPPQGRRRTGRGPSGGQGVPSPARLPCEEGTPGVAGRIQPARNITPDLAAAHNSHGYPRACRTKETRLPAEISARVDVIIKTFWKSSRVSGAAFRQVHGSSRPGTRSPPSLCRCCRLAGLDVEDPRRTATWPCPGVFFAGFGSGPTAASSCRSR